MSYWLTIALPFVRVKFAMPPSTCCEAAPEEPLIGMLASAFSESSRYCGVCMTIGYETPFCGLSQYVGDTWLDPARLTTMLLVTSRAVTPTSCARVRSTSTLNTGDWRDCWMRASATPGIARIFGRTRFA